ncbi:hypothetical protein BpHYR1_040198 [Brachionus plicatilis]|uniref:Uncharacterized protein n=1 Tax=Brachionus plicatilis TaxID=10195 RepID=A0A3M7T185_BRAPC|nr:hypothetical protein BpHYR1_040198 [Brachionus plicatilis]
MHAVLNVLMQKIVLIWLKDCAIDLELRLDKSLSVRQAVNEISIGDGQGMAKCNYPMLNCYATQDVMEGIVLNNTLFPLKFCPFTIY